MGYDADFVARVNVVAILDEIATSAVMNVENDDVLAS
jgi:hypothetical protein